MELTQIIDQKKIVNNRLKHANSGEKALKAAAQEIKNHAKDGGVVHYQRNLAQVSEKEFFQSALIDLMWIDRFFGKVIRLKQYNRLSNDSKQLFLTIRLENQVIVQYGLNSLDGLESTFSFDFSSRGYNLDFDDQIQAPIRLNSTVLANDLFETEIDKVSLEAVWKLISINLKGGN